MNIKEAKKELKVKSFRFEDSDGNLKNRTVWLTDVFDILDNLSLLPVISQRSSSAIKEIENAMERWHHGRASDGETLQRINDILVDIGLLKFFNNER